MTEDIKWHEGIPEKKEGSTYLIMDEDEYPEIIWWHEFEDLRHPQGWLSLPYGDYIDEEDIKKWAKIK